MIITLQNGLKIILTWFQNDPKTIPKQSPIILNVSNYVIDNVLPQFSTSPKIWGGEVHSYIYFFNMKEVVLSMAILGNALNVAYNIPFVYK